MFSVFRKKPSSQKEDTTTAPESVAHHDELVNKADELLVEIEQAMGERKADLLDARGEYLVRAGELDDAIDAYEASLQASSRMGKAYRDLTTLYNKKRAQAAAAGNDEDMRAYFDKLQMLMQRSKDMLRGK